MRRVLRILVDMTVLAGAVAVVRQAREAAAVRRGALRPASASADLPPRGAPNRFAEAVAAWQPSRPASRPGRFAAALWAAPLTLVGLALTTVAGQPARWDPSLGCFVAMGVAGPSARLLRLVGAEANTIGQVVVVTTEHASPALLAHEVAHARQSERLGPLMLPAYALLGARFGYRDHPLERAARRAARAATVTDPPGRRSPAAG